VKSSELNVLLKSYNMSTLNGQNICVSNDESKYLSKYSDMPEGEGPEVDTLLNYSF